MDDFIQHVKDFIAKVKDDPSLSDLFRLAANELHDALNPEEAQAPAAPAEPAPVVDESAEPAAAPEG